jgi:hypothetical protein
VQTSLPAADDAVGVVGLPLHGQPRHRRRREADGGTGELLGSLASALERAAADRGVDLVTVPGNGGSPVSAGTAASVPECGPLSVHIGAEYRLFGLPW